jgi:hypothetical protein
MPDNHEPASASRPLATEGGGAIVLRLISQQVAAERERCAKIAEEYGRQSDGFSGEVYASQVIAAAIRRQP